MTTVSLTKDLPALFPNLFKFSRLDRLKVRLQALNLMPKYTEPVTHRQLAFFLLCALSDVQLEPKKESEFFFDEYHRRFAEGYENGLPTTLDELERIFSDVNRLAAVEEVKINVHDLRAEFLYIRERGFPRWVATNGIFEYKSIQPAGEAMVILRNEFFIKMQLL